MAETGLTTKGNRQPEARHLGAKSVSAASCPQCGQIAGKVDGSQATHPDQVTMVDLATIDAWLDNHAKATGVTVKKLRTQNGRYAWSVQSTPSCEIIYSADRPYLLEMRMVSTDRGHLIEGDPQNLATICARHGCQPVATRQTKEILGMAHTTLSQWGVVQYLSTWVLSEELFEPITTKLSETIKAVKKAFSGSRS